MEKFETCWEDAEHPYLQPLPDTPDHDSAAEPFCSTTDKGILGQVLNSYDQETVDFYRWETIYDRDTLSELVSRRSGIEIGEIREIIPLERGQSGRICRLKIVGSKKTMVVGKELEIRRILSESHLKSSAFEVKMEADRIVLEGSGWGHGVGLCQIGAAVMASRGYTYEEILRHYYPGSSLKS